MRAWIRRSFRNRVFVTMLLGTLAVLLLCGGLMMWFQVARSEASLAREAGQQLTELEQALDAFQSDCRRMLQEMAESTVVHSALRRGGGNSRTLYQVLVRTTEHLRDYARFDVYDSRGQCRYTTAASAGRELDTGWGLLRAAGETGDTVFRTGTDGGLTAALAVRDFSGAVQGYVTATVEQGGFERLFGGLYTTTSEVLLLDGVWRAAYYSRPAQTDATVKALRDQLLDGRPLTGQEGEYRFFALKQRDGELTLLLQQPRAFSSLVLGAIYLAGGLMGALCLALSLLCAWVLSRHLSQPVHQLDEAMGEVEKGNFDVHLETGRADELGRLASSFNRMTEEYRLNLERSVQRQKELNEAKLRMMQAQLNPHFLYNTLDAVKWLGVTHQVPQVAGLATDLAAILRASISGDELVTLERELELVERYVDIQSIRFADRFACEIDVADRYQSCLVPKLALQPLVENAILHGVADKDDGYVKVWAEEKDGDLLLYVSDNGRGIPQEILDRLNSEDQELPGGHLGLGNVDSIIRLYFGPGYGLTAQAGPDGGSRVELRLPVRRKEGDGAEGFDC